MNNIIKAIILNNNSQPTAKHKTIELNVTPKVKKQKKRKIQKTEK